MTLENKHQIKQSATKKALLLHWDNLFAKNQFPYVMNGYMDRFSLKDLRLTVYVNGPAYKIVFQQFGRFYGSFSTTKYRNHTIQ